MKGNRFFTAVFLFLSIAAAVMGADLNCYLYLNTCPSGTSMLSLRNDSGAGYHNAHAYDRLDPFEDYYHVCCNSTDNDISADCGTTFLELSDPDNAHVQDPTQDFYPDYDYDACISGNGTVICDVVPDSCPANYECLFSIASGGESNYTNAHVSSCGTYPLQVCCYGNIAPTQTTPILNSTFGTNETWENLTCHNQSTSDYEDDDIKNIFNWYLEGNSLMLVNLPFEGNEGQESKLVQDYSGNGNNGTVSGATWGDDIGYDGFGAYSFDGTDDFIQITTGFGLDTNDDFTIMAWIDFNQSGAIYSQKDSDCSGNSYIWFGFENVKLTGIINGTSGDAIKAQYGVSFSPGSSGWVAMSWNASSETISLYSNGALIANQSGTLTGDTSSNDWVGIGAEQSCSGQIQYKVNGTHKGWFFYDADLPTDQEPGYGTEYTSGQYIQANLSDDSRASYSPTYLDGGNYETTQYKFVPSGSGTAGFTLTWEGYNTLTTSDTGVNIYAYNFDLSQWTLLASTTSQTETTLQATFPADGYVQYGTDEVWITVQSRGVNCYTSWLAGSCGVLPCSSTQRKYTLSYDDPTGCWEGNNYYCQFDLSCGGLSTVVSTSRWFESEQESLEMNGYGHELNFQEEDICQGEYCSMSDEELSHLIDLSVEKGVEYLLDMETFRQERWDDQYNHILLLKDINTVLEREDISMKIEEMLDIYAFENDMINVPGILASLSVIDPRFDERSDPTYKLLEEGIPEETNLAYNNIQLGIIAPYCQRFFQNYSDFDKERVVRYLTRTALDDSPFGNHSHYYRTTHALYYLYMMYLQGCVPYPMVEGAIDAVIYRNKLMSRGFADWYVEGPSVLAMIGKSDRFNRNWVPIILANQDESGGWPVTENFHEISSHPTGLAVIALLGYKKEVIEGKDSMIRFTFQDSLEEGLGNWDKKRYGYKPEAMHTSIDYDGPESIFEQEIRQRIEGSSQADVHNTMYVDYVSLNATTVINPFNGTIDEFMIWNRTLSDMQIAQISNGETDMMFSDETDYADLWQCEITPNDGIDDGPTLQSNDLRIDNDPPTQSQPILNSTFGLNRTTENLTVYNQSTSDPENHPVKNIHRWIKDGSNTAELIAPFEKLFGDEATTAKDYSGNGNNGTVVGAAHSRTGGFDGRGAYRFDGDGDYVNFTELLTDDTATFGGWIYSNDLGCGDYGWCMVMGQDNGAYDGYELYTWDTGVACLDGSAEASTAEIAADEWHHVMCRNNGTDVAIFVDGELKDTTPSSWSPVSSDFVVGGHPWGDDAWWDGYIDDVIVFDTALSDEQIALIAANRTDMMSDGEIIKDEVWKACITPNDGYEDGAENCSNNLTIANTPPGAPTLISPTNGNDTLFWRNVTFEWNESYDIDVEEGVDNLTYDINITPYSCGTERHYYSINGTNYTTPDDLEVNCIFFWQVRAFDGDDYGNWSETWNFTIEPTIIIEQVDTNVSFGEAETGETNDTEDNSPTPFQIRNEGNVHINLSIYALDSLWDAVEINTSHFQYKAGNTSETGSFNWSHTRTATEWTNIPGYNSTTWTYIAGQLGYRPEEDEVETEIRVWVPGGEPPGNKSSILVFTGET
ncbi:hypothetical protein JW968_07550 [Candidatus Woesearchaeota archaeon]|nr:hypothetical protein [Candidatus Woesearchaeota archaeon]